MASDVVRQISSPFTTRLALVFASRADENIIRIETAQDVFVAFSRRIFFLVDFETTSQQVLKVPRAPREVLLGTFRESTETEQWPHSTARLFTEAIAFDPPRDFPLYVGKEPAAGKRYRKKFERSPNGTAQNRIGRRRCDPLPYGRN